MKSIASILTRKIGLWVVGLVGVSTIGIALLLLLLLIIIISGVAGYQSNQNASNGYVSFCSTTGSINYTLWDNRFESAGVLAGKGDLYIKFANKWGIDPVLFAAISFHETANGTSNAIRNYNNPGGLMDPSTGSMKLYRFATLEDGLDAMGRTLHNRIIRDGLNTVEKLGNVYAPLGAKNDPNGLNQHWIPTINNLASELGGLTMNCEVGAGEVVMDVPAGTLVIPTTGRKTSPFGMRYHPNDKVWRLHAGADIANSKGTPIWSAGDGVVTKVKTGCVEGNRSCGGGWGNHVFVKHNINGQVIETVYAHLNTVNVSIGQSLKGGQVLGTMGHTGNSTGPHLHFELHIGGYKNPVDPYKYIK